MKQTPIILQVFGILSSRESNKKLWKAIIVFTQNVSSKLHIFENGD